MLPLFFCRQPTRQLLNFRVRQDDVRGAESGHGTTSDINLMLNLLGRKSCTDMLEIRPDASLEVRPVTADTVLLKQLNSVRILALAV